jgi:hypothetical protein
MSYIYMQVYKYNSEFYMNSQNFQQNHNFPTGRIKPKEETLYLFCMRIRDANMLESETLKYSVKPKLPHGARHDVHRLIGVHEEQRKANVARNLPRRHFKSAATHSLGRQQRGTQTDSGIVGGEMNGTLQKRLKVYIIIDYFLVISLVYPFWGSQRH